MFYNLQGQSAFIVHFCIAAYTQIKIVMGPLCSSVLPFVHVSEPTRTRFGRLVHQDPTVLTLPQNTSFGLISSTTDSIVPVLADWVHVFAIDFLTYKAPFLWLVCKKPWYSPASCCAPPFITSLLSASCKWSVVGLTKFYNWKPVLCATLVPEIFFCASCWQIQKVSTSRASRGSKRLLKQGNFGLNLDFLKIQK